MRKGTVSSAAQKGKEASAEKKRLSFRGPGLVGGGTSVVPGGAGVRTRGGWRAGYEAEAVGGEGGLPAGDH